MYDSVRTLGFVLCLFSGFSSSTSVSGTELIAGTPCQDNMWPYAYIKNSSHSLFREGETVEVTCKEGYRSLQLHQKSAFIQCQADGSWKDLLGRKFSLSCNKMGTCSPPTILSGEVLTKESGYKLGEIAPVLCNNFNEYKIVCNKDGTWSLLNGGINVTLLCSDVNNCGPLPKTENGQYVLVSTHAHYEAEYNNLAFLTCNHGYRDLVEEDSALSCRNGNWVGRKGKCMTKGSLLQCKKPDPLTNGYYQILNTGTRDAFFDPHLSNSSLIEAGYVAVYRCNDGYEIIGDKVYTCIDSKWSGRNQEKPYCKEVDTCEDPVIYPNAKYNAFSRHKFDDRMIEYSTVYYYCDNGYKMLEPQNSTLQCINGKWVNQDPNFTGIQCRKSNECPQPVDIPNGNWVIKSVIPNFKMFEVGSRVVYTCDDGFIHHRGSVLVCLDIGYWSDFPPTCLPADSYCVEPDDLENGFSMCKPNDCGSFKVGTEVHYLCTKGYMAEEGDSVIKCETGGVWSGVKPTCVVEISHHTADTSRLELNSNTLTVVVVTSSFILGLLFLLVIVVIVQRRRKYLLRHRNHSYFPHLHSPNPPAPTSGDGYDRVTDSRSGSLEESDRTALIDFADGLQVVLPTYEEAIRNTSNNTTNPSTRSGRLHRYNSDCSRGSGRSSRASANDHRLVHHARLAAGSHYPPPSYRDTMSVCSSTDNNPRDQQRNSIITTTSAGAVRGIADNLSLAFGSLDTVNISDNTSTTVTLGTYDSGCSNPSLSQRAVTGSMASANSNPSLNTEEAPLIEQCPVDRCPDVHRSQTASPTIPEEVLEDVKEIVPANADKE